MFAGFGERDAHAARYYYARAEPARYGRGDNGVTLDVDADLLLPVGNSYVTNGAGTTVNPFNTGFGVDARLGFRASAGLVFIQPELEGGLEQLQWVNRNGFLKTADNVGRFMAGARVGNRGIFEFQGYGHLGGAAGGYGISGFAWDIGAAGNFHIRHVTFGLHAGFNQIIGSNPNPCIGGKNLQCPGPQSLSIKWIDIGPNVGLIF